MGSLVPPPATCIPCTSFHFVDGKGCEKGLWCFQVKMMPNLSVAGDLGLEALAFCNSILSPDVIEGATKLMCVRYA